MLITAGPSTTAALFATKLVFETRIVPVWKIAPLEMACKLVEAVTIPVLVEPKSDHEAVGAAEYIHHHTHIYL